MADSGPFIAEPTNRWFAQAANLCDAEPPFCDGESSLCDAAHAMNVPPRHHKDAGRTEFSGNVVIL